MFKYYYSSTEISRHYGYEIIQMWFKDITTFSIYLQIINYFISVQVYNFEMVAR